MDIDNQRELYQRYCEEKFLASSSTSKTICAEKGRRIIKLLTNNLQDNDAADSSDVDDGARFKCWVKTRGFKLISYTPLGLTNVLCLPAKKKVG
jgi:hypothetical protein